MGDVFFRFQEAMLTTLTAAVVLPTKNNKFHLCVCNVGDSLAYVYSKVGNLNYTVSVIRTSSLLFKLQSVVW
jgi:hypothetical protein